MSKAKEKLYNEQQYNDILKRAAKAFDTIKQAREGVDLYTFLSEDKDNIDTLATQVSLQVVEQAAELDYEVIKQIIKDGLVPDDEEEDSSATLALPQPAQSSLTFSAPTSSSSSSSSSSSTTMVSTTITVSTSVVTATVPVTSSSTTSTTSITSGTSAALSVGTTTTPSSTTPTISYEQQLATALAESIHESIRDDKNREEQQMQEALQLVEGLLVSEIQVEHKSRVAGGFSLTQMEEAIRLSLEWSQSEELEHKGRVAGRFSLTQMEEAVRLSTEEQRQEEWYKLLLSGGVPDDSHVG